jgi:bifunctional non-homologous end joining protein LigD
MQARADYLAGESGADETKVVRSRGDGEQDRNLARRAPPGWRRNPPPGFIRPCEPALVVHPPAGPGWLHEVKHDGFRIVALKQGAHVKLWSRRAADTLSEAPVGLEAVIKARPPSNTSANSVGRAPSRRRT